MYVFLYFWQYDMFTQKTKLIKYSHSCFVVYLFVHQIWYWYVNCEQCLFDMLIKE